MKQTEKIEIFFNWLMDNNYFNLFFNQFTAKYSIKEMSYTAILRKLQTINYQNFVLSIVDAPLKNNSFEIILMLTKWQEYCEQFVEEDMKQIVNGDYIKYSVINFGVKTDYIAIIECFEDGFVSEYCSAVISSDDEELTDKIQYYDKYDLNESFISIRKANDDEIKWLDEMLENDGHKFNKDKKELVEF